MTAYHALPESMMIVQESHDKKKKDERPGPVRRNSSFFGRSRRNDHEKPMTTTITTTKTTIENGRRVVDTTTTTITEPAKAKGLKGKLQKALAVGRNTKKVTHVVQTRKTTPFAALNDDSVDTQVPPQETPRAIPTSAKKKQRGVDRVFTPAPVAHKGLPLGFFAPPLANSTSSSSSKQDTMPSSVKTKTKSKANDQTKQQRGVRRVSTPSPVAHKIMPVRSFPNFRSSSQKAVVQQSTPETPPVKEASASPPPKSRAVKRVSTPMPLGRGRSVSSFFGSTSKSPQSSKNGGEAQRKPETVAAVALPEPTPESNPLKKKKSRGMRRASGNSAPEKEPLTDMPSKTVAAAKTRLRIDTSPSALIPAGSEEGGVSRVSTSHPVSHKGSVVPFFGKKKNVPQVPESVAENLVSVTPPMTDEKTTPDVAASGSFQLKPEQAARPGEAPLKKPISMLAAPEPGKNAAPSPQPQPVAVERAPLSPVVLPTAQSPTQTRNNYTGVDSQDVDDNEYEEITILDDEIYEITYFEEETVLDDSRHKTDMQQFVSSTAKPMHPTTGRIKVEGMELLMSNSRVNVPSRRVH